MSDLDTRAREATQELLERSLPEVPSRYAELRRIRARRTAAKFAAVAVAAAVGVGGWQLGAGHHTHLQPAAPTGFRNGALIGDHDVASAASAGWGTAYGPTPGTLPRDAADDEPFLQWSADGTVLYYDDQQNRLAEWDTATSTKRVLLQCPQRGCLGGSISPDGTTGAFLGSGGLVMADLATGNTHLLPLPGVHGGPPAWSPDGRTLAFTDALGLWTVDADGTDLRNIRPPTSVATYPAYSVAWSPDGSRIAFFDTVTPKNGSADLTEYNAMTVARDGSDPTHLTSAGSCPCGRLLPPFLAWSPDGSLIAVATTNGDRPRGIYTVRPDGSDKTLRKEGDWSWLSWQPLPA